MSISWHSYINKFVNRSILLLSQLVVPIGVSSIGWPKKLAHFVLYVLTSTYWPIFKLVWLSESGENLLIELSIKIPSHLKCVAIHYLVKSGVLKATIENKTNSVRVRRPAARRTHWTFDAKKCRMRQLLLTITEIINMLFPVVSFLKYVPTEVVLFLIVALRHWHFTR